MPTSGHNRIASVIADADRMALRRACIADVRAAFGRTPRAGRLAATMLRALIESRLDDLVDRLHGFDALVGRCGLQAAGRQACGHLGRDLEVHGLAHLPARGPLLFVGNHPGLADAAALFAAVGHRDLRVIAARRRLLERLPQTRERLFMLSDEVADRSALIRRAVRHLRAGGCLATYPGGRIEPDPALRPQAATAELARWSSSIDLFARLVPALTVVPVIVGGVLAPAALAHPMSRLRRQRRDREWLAATLQMLEPGVCDNAIKLHVGAPVCTDRGVDRCVRDAVIREAQRMIGRAFGRPTARRAS